MGDGRFGGVIDVEEKWNRKGKGGTSEWRALRFFESRCSIIELDWSLMCLSLISVLYHWKGT